MVLYVRVVLWWVPLLSAERLFFQLSLLPRAKERYIPFYQYVRGTSVL
jgi:hypothetical protein